jgi:hypothetical protein
MTFQLVGLVHSQERVVVDADVGVGVGVGVDADARGALELVRVDDVGGLVLGLVHGADVGVAFGLVHGVGAAFGLVRV